MGMGVSRGAYGVSRQASLLLSTEEVSRKIDTYIDMPRKTDWFTPLMAAAAFGHVSVVNTLIQQSADVNYKRPDPFHDTCRDMRAQTAQLPPRGRRSWTCRVRACAAAGA
jgi:hypothetical protein